jgi:hypothetical protein
MHPSGAPTESQLSKSFVLAFGDIRTLRIGIRRGRSGSGAHVACQGDGTTVLP